MKKEWWQEKAAYQIYPKSFYDANGDGIGDIQGIIKKLDYLKALGIGILWISPMFQSPMVDNGYDISDYYAIDPMFGTMEDMDLLIAEAKKRDISILMDLVVNHCSDRHRWFQEAMNDPEGPYGDYFYIKDGINGMPPTNWRSYFGGSVWEKVPGFENKYYFHSFAKEQPDLNWENPIVRQKIYEMVCWWMEKGLGGFRIDAIMNIKKDLTWSNLPADGPDGLADVYKANQKSSGIGDFLMELKRKCFEPYDGFAIGEAMFLREGEIGNFLGEEGYFSSVFAFEPCHAYRKGKKDYAEYDWPQPLKRWREVTFQNQRNIENAGFEANIIENHDQPRGASLFIPEEDYGFYSVTALAMILVCQRGIPFLYQGQEIGMCNRKWKLQEFNDLETINQYRSMIENGMEERKALEICSRHSRDNARTPMQWSAGKNAGFTAGNPWMTVNENYKTINVENQEKEYGSVLNFYRRLMAFRLSEEYREILTYGTLEPMYEETDHIFAYARRKGKKKLVLICNFSSQPSKVLLQETYENVVFVNYEQTTVVGQNLLLKPYEAVVLEC
jgi:oligo-1,6-glucosidase